MPDYVDQTDPTDQNADSIGCGMAFLSWLISQGHSLNQIAQAMVALGNSGTLAQLYANVTADAASNAWPNFQNAIQALPNGVTSDDPFNGLAQPLQMAHLARLRIGSHGDIPLADARQFLLALEHAYNCLVIFQAATQPSSVAERWIPGPDFGIDISESMVLPSNRLVLSVVKVASPGFWEFLGSMNPLEILRKYLQDRHERGKDLKYRNDQERRAKELEILQKQLDLIEKLKQSGAPEHVVAALFNQLVERPLSALGALQDRGVITIDAPKPQHQGTTTVTAPKSKRLVPPSQKSHRPTRTA